MIQWVSNERSTITKLVEHGRLWIVDKNCRHIAYQSTMLGKFLMKRGGHSQQIDQALGANTPLPHGNEASEKRFTDIIKASGRLVLVL